MRVVLLPCSATEWRDAGRVLGRVELPLTDAGRVACLGWIEQLRTLNLARLYHSTDELAREVAQLLAERLDVPAKAAAEIDEVDVGLWSGLTEADLSARYSSAFRELCESPLHVTPPDGESFREAAQRIRAWLGKRRPKDRPIGVVARPFAFALARCTLEAADFSRVWEWAGTATEPVILESTRVAV